MSVPTDANVDLRTPRRGVLFWRRRESNASAVTLYTESKWLAGVSYRRRSRGSGMCFIDGRSAPAVGSVTFRPPDTQSLETSAARRQSVVSPDIRRRSCVIQRQQLHETSGGAVFVAGKYENRVISCSIWKIHYLPTQQDWRRRDLHIWSFLKMEVVWVLVWLIDYTVGKVMENGIFW